MNMAKWMREMYGTATITPRMEQDALLDLRDVCQAALDPAAEAARARLVRCGIVTAPTVGQVNAALDAAWAAMEADARARDLLACAAA